MPEKSRLMPISYYNPKQEIRLSAYADTIVLEPDGREQRLRAIRFGGYPEMVRAMSDAIYAGATLETEFAGEPAMLACEPKKYECHLSHDGIYAEATILSLDDEDAAAKKDEEAQADGAELIEPTTDEVTYSDGTTDEVYGFDIPVEKLDEDFNVAIIGKKGTWYDHVVSVSNPVPQE